MADSLFLDYNSFTTLLDDTKNLFIPMIHLSRKGYIAYNMTNMVHDIEKNKLYNLFMNETEKSKKKIKRITITDQNSVNIIGERLATHRQFEYAGKNLKFSKVLPNIEIIEWPENTYLSKYSFNQLTKNKYIPSDTNTYIGTFIVPLINTKTSTEFVNVGQDQLDKTSCVCKINSCRCKDIFNIDYCRCIKGCRCHYFKYCITGNNCFFYLSNIEPKEILGEKRLNMYVHILFNT